MFDHVVRVAVLVTPNCDSCYVQRRLSNMHAGRNLACDLPWWRNGTELPQHPQGVETDPLFRNLALGNLVALQDGQGNPVAH